MSALICNESVPPTPDLLEQTGATYRQIDYWISKGYLHPLRRRGADGSGSPRVWPGSEIRVAERMAILVTVGLTPAAAHHAARKDGLLPGGRYRLTEVTR